MIPCKNCKKLPAQHGENGKCLFESTFYFAEDFVEPETPAMPTYDSTRQTMVCERCGCAGQFPGQRHTKQQCFEAVCFELRNVQMKLMALSRDLEFLKSTIPLCR